MDTYASKYGLTDFTAWLDELSVGYDTDPNHYVPPQPSYPPQHEPEPSYPPPQHEPEPSYEAPPRYNKRDRKLHRERKRRAYPEPEPSYHEPSSYSEPSYPEPSSYSEPSYHEPSYSEPSSYEEPSHHHQGYNHEEYPHKHVEYGSKAEFKDVPVTYEEIEYNVEYRTESEVRTRNVPVPYVHTETETLYKAE